MTAKFWPKISLLKIWLILASLSYSLTYFLDIFLHEKVHFLRGKIFCPLFDEINRLDAAKDPNLTANYK